MNGEKILQDDFYGNVVNVIEDAQTQYINSYTEIFDYISSGTKFGITLENIAKYSELLKEFVHPIVSEADDISIVRTKYVFGAHAWNAAIMREKSEEVYQLAKKDISSIMPDVPEIEQLFDEMAKRKQEEFSEFKNIIADFEIKKIRGLDYDLTVATTPLKD